MPMSSKFLTESTGEKIVKIDQYLAKIWTKYDSLVFFGPPCTWPTRQLSDDKTVNDLGHISWSLDCFTSNFS